MRRTRVALPRVREPRVQRPARALPQLHVVSAANGSRSCGSEDSHGRALWALGTVVGRSGDPGQPEPRRRSVPRGAPGDALRFTSPRAWAYALLGIDEYLARSTATARCSSFARELAERLLELFRSDAAVATGRGSRIELTYCNARLSQALIVSGARMDDREMTTAGLDSLDWLAGIQRSPDGYFAPDRIERLLRSRQCRSPRSISSRSRRAAMVSACLDAPARDAATASWAERAQLAFDWFLGQNHLQQPVYDATTGGCRDGLHAGSRERESRRGVDALVPDGARGDARGRQRRRAHRPHVPRVWSRGPRMSNGRFYETLFTRHNANPILTAARLAVSGAQRLQPRRDAARRRHDAAPVPGRGSTRALTSLRRALGQRRRSAGRSIRRRRSCRIREHHPEELWGIEDPAHHLRRRTGQVRHRVHRVQHAADPAWRSRSPRTSARSSAAGW